MKHLPLHRRTKHIISALAKRLESECPWCECFAEIAALDEAVRKTFEPAEIDQIAIMDEGILVGAVEDTGRKWWQFWKPKKLKGTRFHPLTLNAEDWFEEWCRCWPNQPEMQLTGFLYASAHSMEPEALLRTWNDKYALAREVWWWRCRCGIKRGQVAPIQRLLMPETPWPKSSGKGDVEKEGYAGWGWMTAVLCQAKPDPEYWTNKVPMLKALQKYRDIAMYGEMDKEVKSDRWSQWRDMAQAEEWNAKKRLEAAWKAVAGEKAEAPTTTPPEEEEGHSGQSEGKDAPPQEERPLAAFPKIDGKTVERMVKAGMAEIAGKKGS